MAFDRYRDIIPDFDQFLECASRPEPTTIRVRSGRIEAGALAARLEEQGFGLRALAGQPDFFQVEREPKPIALTLEHWLGLFYVQRASTGIAAPVLGPRPGERVLDLCAAPGGKTTHMADLMGDRGPLVAVEPSESRIRALAGNVYRTAHLNVLTVAADGRFLPGGALFDRVLVDAPCSAEGTVREGKGRVRGRTDRFTEYVSGLQEALLRRAIDLTRPGGTVLYSTCTFAPEENEAVVDAVLADAPVDLVPLQLEVPAAPGLTEFEGRRFDGRLAGAARVYPHHLDSGGLFLALLRKDPPDSDSSSRPAQDRGWSAIPRSSPSIGRAGDASLQDMRIEAVEEALERTWQVDPRPLGDIGWLIRNDRVWAHGCGEWPFDAWAGQGGWSSVSVGLRAFSFDSGGLPRPSNDFFRWLGAELGGRSIDLDRSEGRALLRGEPVGVAEVSDGYVAIRLSGLCIGRGFVRSGSLRHEIPAVHSRSLRRILETDAEFEITS